MSHEIHHTEGFIISSRNVGEANKYISIYTRDFGMVRALAQGVRKITSKLRYSLQDFSYSQIDLVRGREVWRITNARRKVFLEDLEKKEEVFVIMTNIFSLLERFHQGEGENEILFDHLVKDFNFLANCGLQLEELKNIEIVIVFKILYYLGYIDPSTSFSYLINESMDLGLLKRVTQDRKLIISIINNAIKESQL